MVCVWCLKTRYYKADAKGVRPGANILEDILKIKKKIKKSVYNNSIKKWICFYALLFLVISTFSCQKQSVETSIKEKKPQVKINLVLEKGFPLMPIKIILEGEEGDYIKKIQKDKFNYSFYDLKPGKYFIGFIFLEEIEGKKYEFKYNASWDYDGKKAKTENNEIKVYKNRPVEIKLFFFPNFSGPDKRNEIKEEIFLIFARSHWFYKQKHIKEREKDFYEIYLHMEIYVEEK